MSVTGARPAAWAGRRPGIARALLTALIVALVLSFTGGCGGSVPTKVLFLQDWEAAKERAASENKPIMINFYSDT